MRLAGCYLLWLSFAGKTHRTVWFENAEIPSDWTIAVSDNGWTNDQLGFDWLQSVFETKY